MTKSKNHKTVIVTGASCGIGRTIAILFSINNYNVLINYNHSENGAIKLRNRLRGNNPGIDIFKADVSIRKQVNLMVEHCLDRFGGIDLLINNAGLSQQKTFLDISEDEWDEIMKVNLKGVFNCSQSVLNYMVKQKKGKIINISSIWGITGASCEVHYSAAKSGIIGFTKALAKEFGPSNIQVNCVAPGIIKTNMIASLSKQELDVLKFDTPLMRLGRPRDIAACAFFLASKDADFITGQVISPNGGFIT